ncbi:MAG: Rieske 2Fe-2S domain-containing protein [Chloroflexi bacterium]|nr:Rieske 2Fe-2S domain-containing protein [Chloroflexota bacterium]
MANGNTQPTSEGGQQRRVPQPAEPSGGSRPQRAPHLRAESRPGVVQSGDGARAMVTRAQRRRAMQGQVTRRQLLRVSFWGFFTFSLTGGLGAFLSNFWPRGVTGFGGRIAVSAATVPEAGTDPAPVQIGKFYLSHLQAGQGTHAGFGEEGEEGLLALWWKCPHLGCTIPWRPGFPFEGVTGWFRCPCHGSTYTRGGIRVFGPAPRPMDTMEITVNSDGSLTVDTGKITKGGADNPLRTTTYG